MFLNKIVIRINSVRLCARLKHNINKQTDDRQSEKSSKVSQDLIKYLESDEEYRTILPNLPKILLKKYKSPETMYLINKTTAEDICHILKPHFESNAPIVEVNPGLGLLTEAVLKCQDEPVHLYESSNYFNHFLNDLQSKYPERVTCKFEDFFGMWKLAFLDKIDDGNRIKELLGDLATHSTERKLKIIGAMPGLSFVKHLINTIVFHNTTNQLGRPDLYITMPVHHYEFLTDTLVEQGKHKSVPSLFQTLFHYKVLKKIPKAHFLPWTFPLVNKKASMVDDHFLYLVNIIQKETLPCPPSYLPLLWYFFKPQSFSKRTRVIPMLEQWIPGCGVWLITGQEPADVNRELSPGPDDAPLPHMTIFTEFGDLSLQQKVTVFKRFVSWPEFEQCQFRATMENNLPKFATNLDHDVKNNLDTHIDDLDEQSDSESEPENV